MTDSSEQITQTIPPLLSPTTLAIRRFRKHTMAMVGLGILVLLFLYVSFTGLALHGYCLPLKQEVYGEAWANCNDTSVKFLPPSSEHLFGTDVIGRDILARTENSSLSRGTGAIIARPTLSLNRASSD